jgi:hypothetical protein
VPSQEGGTPKNKRVDYTGIPLIPDSSPPSYSFIVLHHGGSRYPSTVPQVADTAYTLLVQTIVDKHTCTVFSPPPYYREYKGGRGRWTDQHHLIWLICYFHICWSYWQLCLPFDITTERKIQFFRYKKNFVLYSLFCFQVHMIHFILILIPTILPKIRRSPWFLWPHPERTLEDMLMESIPPPGRHTHTHRPGIGPSSHTPLPTT